VLQYRGAMTNTIQTGMTVCYGIKVSYDCVLEHTGVMTNAIKMDVTVCYGIEVR